MGRGAGGLAGRALRGGWGFLAGLVLVVALGGGASIGAAVAAHRTDRAYLEYVEEAEVAELAINPSLSTASLRDAIEAFEDVEAVHVNTLLFASAVITEPTTIAEGGSADSWTQVLGSIDGRFVDVDRPAVREGRVPSGAREVFVSDDYVDELERVKGRDLGVGDEIEVGFFWAGLFLAEDLDPDALVEPLGVERLRISGFGALADEVLPDELWPRQRLIVSEDVTNRYACLPEYTPDMTYEEAITAYAPPDCASQYDYYSFNVRGGADGVQSVRRQFEDAIEELSSEVPAALAEQGVGYFPITQERADLDDAVGQTTRPTVTALLAFAVIAALATLTVAGLMVARQQQRTEPIKHQLRALGATRWQLTAWSISPLLLAAIAGVGGALAVAFLASPVGPVGSVRVVTPTPGFSVPASAALPSALIVFGSLSVIVVAVVARSAWRVARPATKGRARAGHLRALVERGSAPATTGVGAALDARRAGAGIAAMVWCAVATAVATAAVVFGASLSTLVNDPEAYAWPWDISVLTGGGYGDTVPEAVEDRLSEPDVRDDIADYDFYSFEPSGLLDGEASPVVFGFPNAFDTSFPVLEGRAASVAGEAVLGVDTARALDIDVGDTIALEAHEIGEQEIEIVGLSVLPQLGSFVADRTGLGTGAFVLIDKDPATDFSASLTAIELRDGVDPASVRARLEPDLATWSQLFEVPWSNDEPVRAPEIVNVSELRSAPLALGGLLLASLALGLWLAITLSVRDRQRELAVLRALGFGDRDVRRSVRWQGLTLVTAGLVLGVPLGVVVGRLAWRTFADRLGVVPEITVPLPGLVALTVVTIALTWVAVALPARAAARVSPSDQLLVV